MSDIEHNSSCADYRPAYRCPACMRTAILAMEGERVLLKAAVEQLRAALSEIWLILINQPCLAGSKAWVVADNVLDADTKKAIIDAGRDEHD